MREVRKRVVAIASGGGHWEQLMRLRSALEKYDVAYATVDRAYARDVQDARFHLFPDATRWNKARLLWMALRVFGILLWERPHVVISTGAAPGYFGLRFGKLLGARTIWIDSIANVETLSLSGQRVGRYADLWLTQWPHLAKPGGPSFGGAVL